MFQGSGFFERSCIKLVTAFNRHCKFFLFFFIYYYSYPSSTQMGKELFTALKSSWMPIRIKSQSSCHGLLDFTWCGFSCLPDITSFCSLLFLCSLDSPPFKSLWHTGLPSPVSMLSLLCPSASGMLAFFLTLLRCSDLSSYHSGACASNSFDLLSFHWAFLGQPHPS